MGGDRPGADDAKASAALHDLETQRTQDETLGGFDERERLVPGLTILGHPDWTRIGDRIALPALAAARPAVVSRTEPHFRGPTTGDALPLGLLTLSRQPIQLVPGADPGSIVIDVRAWRIPVVANGQRIDESRTFASDDVTRGIVLELGRWVVLLLHPLPCMPAAPRAADELVGESLALAGVRDEIERLAALEVPVLLRGETGTGKELVAQALHARGPRAARPFVALSMATLPATLAAAELFGAEKGAYTGADRRKQGFFDKANGGTLFLDEIGEASSDLQAMLLRVLETGEMTPVGSVETRAVDVRIIAATDADLEEAMAEKRFRSPLFHRLSGYTIRVPRLADRRDDIGRLLFHFLELELRELDRRPAAPAGRPWPPADLVARLVAHDWPGNVRQLRNVARWLTVKGRDGTARSSDELDRMLGDRRSSDDQPATSRPPRPTGSASGVILYRSPRDVSDDELMDALRAHQWRLKPTAKHLRVSRTSLYALIDRCPSIRRARDLGRDELASSFEQHGGDLVTMAADLEISPQGLRHRLQELGIPDR